MWEKNVETTLLFQIPDYSFSILTYQLSTTYSENTDNPKEISKLSAERLAGLPKMAKSSEKSVGLEPLNSSTMLRRRQKGICLLQVP